MVYGTCFLCGKVGEMELHHVFPGSLRDKSTKYGYLVPLCGEECHRNGKKSAHGCLETANALKRHFQRLYMIEHMASVVEFRQEFYKNYLTEDEYEDERDKPMNMIAISGTLASDPRLFKSKSGNLGASFSVAVKDGKKTDYIDCVTWDESDVGFLERYFFKGKAIEITGTLKQKVHEKNGTKYHDVFIRTSTIHFGQRDRSEYGNSDSANNQANTEGQNATPAQVNTEEDADLPF